MASISIYWFSMESDQFLNFSRKLKYHEYCDIYTTCTFTVKLCCMVTFPWEGGCQIVEVVKDYNSTVLRYGPIPGLRSRPAGFTCTWAMSDSSTHPSQQSLTVACKQKLSLNQLHDNYRSLK